MRVYIISWYEENGAQGVRATLDKNKVSELVSTHPEHRHPLSKEYELTLKSLLEADAPIDGQDLGKGWGGFQLHIVELE